MNSKQPDLQKEYLKACKQFLKKIEKLNPGDSGSDFIPSWKSSMDKLEGHVEAYIINYST
ncbi:MAG: hypothetical protein RL662_2369 [Bacteroidota bacterium]|jgi:hypothetical protein